MPATLEFLVSFRDVKVEYTHVSTSKRICLVHYSKSKEDSSIAALSAERE